MVWKWRIHLALWANEKIVDLGHSGADIAAETAHEQLRRQKRELGYNIVPVSDWNLLYFWFLLNTLADYCVRFSCFPEAELM